MKKKKEEHLTQMATQSLECFKSVSSKANAELARREGVIGDVDVLTHINTMRSDTSARNARDIRAANIRDFAVLSREPAIARVVVEGESGKTETFYFCRASSLKVGNIKLTRINGPLGEIAEKEAGDTFRRFGKECRISAKTVFEPIYQKKQWDSSMTKHWHESAQALEIRSLQLLIQEQDESRRPEDGVHAESGQGGDGQNVSLGVRRDVITELKLREQTILDQYQGKIFRQPIDRCLFLSGSPGTGKTTTLIRRLIQKLDLDNLKKAEKTLIDTNVAEFSREHLDNWLVFAPGESLQRYIRAAIEREHVPRDCGTVATWNSFRKGLLSSEFSFLKISYGNTGYVVRDSDSLLDSEAAKDTISWFEDFFDWLKSAWMDDLEKGARVIVSRGTPKASAFGRVLEERFSAGRSKSIAQILWGIVSEFQTLREFRGEPGVAPFLKPIEGFLGELTRKYAKFKRQRHQEATWYGQKKYNSKELHPLEVDLILLATFRVYRGLLEGSKMTNIKNSAAWPSLVPFLNLCRGQIFVDEAADFSPIQLACMTSLAHPAYQSFFACGDLNQRLTAWGVKSTEELKWACEKIEVKKINIVYRQSRRLNMLSQDFLANRAVSFQSAELPVYVDIEGVLPILLEHQSDFETVSVWLVDRIVEIKESAEIFPTIAIFVSSDSEVGQLSEILEPALATYDIGVTACRNGQIVERQTNVTIIDVRQMKGLEFEAVFFVGADRFAHVEPALFEEYFYVGITRAATYLGITCGDKLPEQLESLREHFSDTW